MKQAQKPHSTLDEARTLIADYEDLGTVERIRHGDEYTHDAVQLLKSLIEQLDTVRELNRRAEERCADAFMEARGLKEQFDALRAAVQKELDYMDGFPDVEDGSPLALVIESLRLALSNPASRQEDA